jgi:hypothetical protein
MSDCRKFSGNNRRKKLLDRVTSEEIKRASFDMKPLKAQRPDGFQPFFFQNQWVAKCAGSSEMF